MKRPATAYELLTSPSTVVRDDGSIFWRGEEFFLTDEERRVVSEECVTGLRRWAGRNSRRTTNIEVG